MNSEAPDLVAAFVLDESGSMYNQTQPTIDGVNQYLDDLRTDYEGKKVLISLTKFSTESTIVHAADALEDVLPLTSKTYHPNGCTALFDAVGDTIAELEKRIDGETPALVVIMTDGAENASSRYGLEQIQTMITEKKKKDWTFIFLGAGEEKWVQGFGKSIGVQSSVSYDASCMAETMLNVSAGRRAYSSARLSGGDADLSAEAFTKGFVAPDMTPDSLMDRDSHDND